MLHLKKLLEKDIEKTKHKYWRLKNGVARRFSDTKDMCD